MYEGQLVDFTIEDNCYVQDKFIGTTVAKKITVNILNPNNSINLENKTIEVFVGIEINGKLEEIPYGTYIIEKDDDQEVKARTNFVGYDTMIKFNIPYVHDDNIVYPTKLSNVLESLCKQVGLELGSTDFVNSDYMVQGNPFTNNEDCRTVLSNIAQLAGGFAKIGRDNKVYIKSLEKTPEGLLRVKEVHNMPVKDLDSVLVKELASYRDSAEDYVDKNTYFDDFIKHNQYGEINSLVLSISSIEGENTSRTDDESIEKNGLTEITIEDNYFLINEEERNKVIETLWNALKGIYYLPFKTKYYGYPYLDCGDMVAVDDMQNYQTVSYILNHTFTYNGAFSGNIDTPAITKTQVAYKNNNNIKSKFRKVERSVDKVNGVISDVIEQQTETADKVSKQEQTITQIQDTVKEVDTKVDDTKEELTTQITQTADEIKSEVSKKVGEDEVCSIISQSAEEILLRGNRVLIESDNFTLGKNGNITATGGTIGGFTLGETEFTGNLNGLYDYNEYDMRLIKTFILDDLLNWDLVLGDVLYNILDANNDGNLNSGDFAKINQIILGKTPNTKTATGTVKINSKDPKNCISITSNGELCVGLGVGGINTNIINTQTIVCGLLNNSNFSGITMAIENDNPCITIQKEVDGSSTGETLAKMTNTLLQIGNLNIGTSIRKGNPQRKQSDF